MNTPQLSFQVKNLPQNLYRIDVVGKNIPKNFLGTAFNIVIEGASWEYQGYKLGPLFHKPINTIAMITQVEKPVQKIVFGVTMKRGFKIETGKGVLASFYIKVPSQKNLTIYFQNGIFSVFDAERKNLPSVKWENTKVKVKSFHPSPHHQTEEDLIAMTENSPQSEILSEQIVNSLPDMTTPPNPKSVEHQFNWALVFLVSIFTLTMIFILIKRKYLRHMLK